MTNRKKKKEHKEEPVFEHCRLSMRLSAADLKDVKLLARGIGLKLDDIVNDIAQTLANHEDPVVKLAPLYKLRYAIKRHHASKSFDMSAEKLEEHYRLIEHCECFRRLT